MSEFKRFESFLVPLGSSIQTAKDTIKAAAIAAGWQIIGESLPATAMASSTWGTGATGSYPAANALDMSPSTFIYSNPANPWLAIQADTAFTPEAIYMTSRSDTANNEPPLGFSLEWSNDGSTGWTVHQSFSTTGWLCGETKRFAVTGAPSKVYWRIYITTKNGSSYASVSAIMLENAAKQRLVGATAAYFDMIPPATETIGGSGAYEFVRVKFTGANIYIYPMKRWTDGIKQIVYAYQGTAGAVTASMTIGGVTVSHTGNAGTTEVDNIAGLYDAIQNSTDPNFTQFDWAINYPAPQNADDANTYIIGTAKAVGANVAVTGSNLGGVGTLRNASPELTELSENMTTWNNWTLTTDLVNGFIYYAQFNARTLVLATKTNVGFYGPIYATYQNHASALAYMPVDSQYLTPIELVVGNFDDNTNLDAYARPATAYAINGKTLPMHDPGRNNQSGMQGGGTIRHRFYEAVALKAMHEDAASMPTVRLHGSGIFVDNSATGNDFQAHRLKTLGPSTLQQSTSYSGSPFLLVPGLDLEDVYKFRGTASNESLALIAETVNLTALAAPYTPGDATISVVDGTKLVSAGFVIIGNEAMEYTGKSGNTLTGVTGARYATRAAKHHTGDKVAQGLWMVTINGGLLFAGYTKPS